jgi:hypothetical protein
VSLVVVVLPGGGVGYDDDDDDDDEGMGMIEKGVVVDGEVRVLLRASFEEVSVEGEVLIVVLVVVGIAVGSVLGLVGFA